MKNIILNVLRTYGRLPLYRIAAILGENIAIVSEHLKDMEKNNLVSRLELPIATYWEINK